MARFFQILGIVIVIAFVWVMIVGIDGSIEGKWTCIQGGRFAYFDVSSTNNGFGITEIEFSDNSLIIKGAEETIFSYPYKIVGDGYISFGEDTLEYKVKNWELHIYDGLSECIFKKSW